MPIRPPALDDRTFDSLVDELVTRIPAHTPEWTNPRVGDPGREARAPRRARLDRREPELAVHHRLQPALAVGGDVRHHPLEHVAGEALARAVVHRWLAAAWRTCLWL